MIIGVIRRPYTVRYRLRKDDPNSDITLTFQRAKTGAIPFPWPTHMGNPEYDKDKTWAGIGEVPGTRKYLKQIPTQTDLPGKTYIGEENWWRFGLPPTRQQIINPDTQAKQGGDFEKTYFISLTTIDGDLECGGEFTGEYSSSIIFVGHCDGGGEFTCEYSSSIAIVGHTDCGGEISGEYIDPYAILGGCDGGGEFVGEYIDPYAIVGECDCGGEFTGEYTDPYAIVGYCDCGGEFEGTYT